MAIHFYKVTELPGTLVPDSIYYVKNGDYCVSYVTDLLGIPHPLGTIPGGTLVSEHYDSITQTHPSSTQDQFKYWLGALLVATVTLTYSDATKADLLSAVRT